MFTEESVDSYVSAKLSTNAFNDDNYVVRVPFTTVSTNGIITEIANDYPSIDPYVIQHSLELVKAKILQLLKQGRSVDVLELGTLYLKPDSTVKKLDPTVSEMPSLSVKFRVNSATRSALADVTISSFMISDPSPVLAEITNMQDGNTDGVLYLNYMVQVKGQNLKLPDDAVTETAHGVSTTVGGIYFVPIEDDGTPSDDWSEWIEVTGYLAKNTPSYLQFYPPASVTTGIEYFICVRTNYLSATTTRKEMLEGYTANTITVIAKNSDSSGLSAPAPAASELPSANTEATQGGEES